MKTRQTIPSILLIASLALGFGILNTTVRGEDLTCLKPSQGLPAGSSLYYADLQQQAYAALERRAQEFEKVKTAEQITQRQSRLRELLTQQLGGFPERTPLNPQVVGKIEADGYVIEKVIFESQPKHHVTANLYLPKGAGPFPVVLVSSGHSRTAKTADYNQRFALACVQAGIAAMAYDPIGQGERSQILDADGKPQFSGTTTEHTLMGVGSILVGTNTARYRVWDGMRAIDYVASRPELDASRIGFTGCSGGGTLTSYVMALDERVACAAPACYLTNFRHLLETLGPQDAEQNIFGQITLGIDHPDYVFMRAPRPTIISSTTGDYFDIHGAWDTYRQAKRIYTRLGFPERVDLVEAEGKHGVQPENLLGITRFLRRWLLSKDDAFTLGAMNVKTEAELLCTPQGQVLRLPGERSVFDLNGEIESKQAVQRKTFWGQKSTAEALTKVRELAGIRPVEQLPEPKFEDIGRVDRENYHIDKFVLTTDSAVPIPGLTYHPAKPEDDAYLYLHPAGKAADGDKGGPIEKLLEKGRVVVAIDFRGVGETGMSAKPDSLLPDSRTFFMSYLLGQSLVGSRTEDTLAAARFVAHYKVKKPRKVHLVAVGSACIPALHAAALAPDLFTTVTLKQPIDSWVPVVRQSVPAGHITNTVHGALGFYDLPDLVRVIAKEKLTIEK